MCVKLLHFYCAEQNSRASHNSKATRCRLPRALSFFLSFAAARIDKREIGTSPFLEKPGSESTLHRRSPLATSSFWLSAAECSLCCAYLCKCDVFAYWGKVFCLRVDVYHDVRLHRGDGYTAGKLTVVNRQPPFCRRCILDYVCVRTIKFVH